MGEIARIIAWNMNGFSSACDDKAKSRRIELFEGMLDEHKPSLFSLQEAFADIGTRLSADTRSAYTIIHSKTNVSGYMKSAWTEFGKRFHHETIRVVMVPLRHTSVPDTFVRFWNVHLPRHEESKEELTGAVKLLCVALEEKRRAKRSNQKSTEILAGDFNMDPFDPRMIARHQVNANRSIDFADSDRVQKPYETKEGRLHNPTWSLLGRTKPPLGTYYKTGWVGGPWYVYDQVLLSPEHCIRHRSQARLITKVNKTTLYSPRSAIRSPDESIGSDHFPLRVRFQVGTP